MISCEAIEEMATQNDAQSLALVLTHLWFLVKRARAS